MDSKCLKSEDVCLIEKCSRHKIHCSYPCEWGGVLDGKPMVRSLEEFGGRVLNNLWNALLKEFPDEVLRSINVV